MEFHLNIINRKYQTDEKSKEGASQTRLCEYTKTKRECRVKE